MITARTADLNTEQTSCLPLRPALHCSEARHKETKVKKGQEEEEGKRFYREANASLCILKTTSNRTSHPPTDSPGGRRSLRPLTMDGIKERSVPEPQRVPVRGNVPLL